MRKAYIAGNWKMNMTPSKGAAFACELAKAAKEAGADVKIMVAPPFVTIPAVVEALKGSDIIVAAQNMNDHKSGAYTGEVAPEMLKDLGVSTVILGHSERRSYYGESDEFINRKVLLAIEEGMDVVLCVGETLEEREAGKLEEVLSTQLSGDLKDVSAEAMSHITIAYEPVWAIGTGKTATPEDADSAHAFIRSFVAKLYSSDIAEGALVGGASLSVEKFLPIITYNK